ncbi:MAG TPA: polysaccharide lyase family 8 super-sandwich domain-containing protein [Bacteroidales bacterium]|nr:polysaccharide lyase family 8 super-sandwich domain-containing protein [Bacteroidales bacterium]HPF01671.1 polysaccharide lyase family 8 super-sandwich domain-containing protein [Bacteroidales bacterium]HPJ58680.1 polysaccharide lyase family 8 super-sandwich domain-containing protein [Bacteroidales bacterium]HPR12367.1 polysaccharide lyase family 8 super-sandwich domain-containing protein [Bacteroidales bacterium]HRW84587.1 polysaccharide lyase family 8 super-sandwich domain-containing prote
MKYSLIRCLILGLVILCWTGVSDIFSQPGLITGRIRDNQISQTVNDDEVTDLLSSLGDDGSWNDIDYSSNATTNWPPVNHSSRLLKICRAYNKPSSIHYRNTFVRGRILKILDYYIMAGPVSSNWWYNAIGAPLNFGPALVLMKSGDGYGIEDEPLRFYADTLLKYYSESSAIWTFSTTGANKIWLLTSSVNKACIFENDAVLEENFQSAFEEIAIMPGKAEGIKTDYSFHQHGPQLYSGGYGSSFLAYMSDFTVLSAGTKYGMSPDRMQIICDALLDGYQWLIHRSAFDFGAIGREISRSGAGSSISLRNSVNRIISTDPPCRAELTAMVNFINGNLPFQEPGNRHFWKSDIMVQHGSDFYLSARVPSRRTIGTERMNNENLKRKWFSWGTTCIMTEGDEYRNIYPVWDWAKIPGVTSANEEVQGLPQTGPTYNRSASEFAGGVSDGVHGMAAYDYSWEGVKGRKAWFFSPVAMFCMGADISSTTNQEIITTINQCFSSGRVIVASGDGKTEVDNSEMNFTGGLKWVYHDDVGYFFPSGGNVFVRNMLQTGKWSDINLSQSEATVTHKVFSTWLSHGIRPGQGSYEYVVAPSMSEEEFEGWIRYCPLRVVINTPDIQAVRDLDSGLWGIAFYKAGTVTLGPGIFITTDQPCLMLVETNIIQSKFKLTIADPAASQETVNVRITKKLTGPFSTINPDNSTSISITLPQGDDAGKSLSLEYTSEYPVNSLSLDRIIAYPNPSADGFYLTNASAISRINVFDQNGRLLYNSGKPAEYKIGMNWDPGVYIFNIVYDDDPESRKQTLIKLTD